jgi:hypothetical protein
MELLRGLAREEQEEFDRLRHSQNGIDEKTYELCLRFYSEYKSKVGQVALKIGRSQLTSYKWR